MGITTTNLHILRPFAKQTKWVRAIERGYSKLGYDRVESEQGDPLKCVAIFDNTESIYVSVYDTDNDKLDTGELKELALRLSKTLRTRAILTSIYDSDSFELLLYSHGTQLDAIVSDADHHTGNLNIQEKETRPMLWENLFVNDHVVTTPPDDLSFEEAYEAQKIALHKAIKDAEAIDTTFAEEQLTAWSKIALLDPKAVLTYPHEIIEETPDKTHILTLQRNSNKLEAMSNTLTTSKIPPLLETYHDNDDCRIHRMHPAAWPVASNKEKHIQWLIVHSGGGFYGLHLDLMTEASAPAFLKQCSINAFPFYNGQITSPNEIAGLRKDLDVDLPIGETQQSFELAPFHCPFVDPETRKRTVFIMSMVVELPDDVTTTFKPTLTPLSGNGEPVTLPPIRLHACPITWLPQPLRKEDCDISTMSQYELENALLLNEPAIFSMTAILPSAGEDTLQDIRKAAETWRSGLAPTQDLSIVIRTEKHMTASGNITKKAHEFAFDKSMIRKTWQKLFAPKSDLQTIFIDLIPSGAKLPVAGLYIQSTLRDNDIINEGNTNSDVPCDWYVSFWIANANEAMTSLNTDKKTLKAFFRDWLQTQTLHQAWITETAWIPEFDVYDDYSKNTLYEDANETCAEDNHSLLRFVAPEMWIGAPLAEHLDLTALTEHADITKEEGFIHMRLKSGHMISDLEAALAPILPPAGQPALS